MIQNKKLEILTVLAILGLIAVFLSVSQGGEYEFSGSDNVGSEKIAEITGLSTDSYTPLIPQYEPPSGEIESTLFALQASFGGLILGLVFGYWIGQKNRGKDI